MGSGQHFDPPGQITVTSNQMKVVPAGSVTCRSGRALPWRCRSPEPGAEGPIQRTCV